MTRNTFVNLLKQHFNKISLSKSMRKLIENANLLFKYNNEFKLI